MPLSGTRDLTPLLERAPRMPGLDAEPWALPGAEILQATFEIDDAAMTSLLPPALHPTIPPTVIVTLLHTPESPAGPFSLAHVRAGCRAGVRPRGFLLSAYCDSGPAAAALAAGWGFGCRTGEVRLRRYHDRITGSVTVDGDQILEASLLNPEPISGSDVQYVASMNLARLEAEGGAPVLVQVDPEYTFHRAERGRPRLSIFVPEAWDAEGLRPVYPIVASFAKVDTGLPRIRYVLDPERPAVQGTRAVGERS
jgi:hypothetical protein